MLSKPMRIHGWRWRRTHCFCHASPKSLTETDSIRRLCGVRITRNGLVCFVDPAGLDSRPGEIVVVDLQGKERLGVVVFAADQLVWSEVDVSPEGRISRAASEEDIARLGMDAPRIENGALGAGLPEAWVEWLADQASEATVRVATEDHEPSVSSFIERLFPKTTSTGRTEETRNRPGSHDRPGEA